MNLVDEEWLPTPTDGALLRRVRAAVKGAVSPADVGRLRALLLAPPLLGAVPHEARGAVWILLLGLRTEDLLAGDAGLFARAAREAVSEENGADQIERDVERTRPGLARFKQPEVRGALLRLLSLFCSQENVSYIQGLNELLAPFVLLADTGGNPRIVYSLFAAFINRFAPWMLDTSESRVFDVLKRAFKYFGRLLLYHDPELYWYLDKEMMTPDLYATSWFVTLFARNFTVETVLALWDLLLLDDNPLGTFFFGLALLTSKREELLNCDPARLPESLMMLGASSPEEVRALWRRASTLRAANTPPSFQRLMFDRLLVPGNTPSTSSESAARSMQNSVCLQTTPDDLTSVDTSYCTWDCRTRPEFDSGHLSQATYLPLDALRAASGDPGDFSESGELAAAFLLCQPLMSTTHICLVGTGDKDEDNTDVNVLALFLSKKGVPYISTLRGGFNPIAKASREDDSLLSVELIDFQAAAHESAWHRRTAASTARAHRRALKQAVRKAALSAQGIASDVSNDTGLTRDTLANAALAASSAVRDAASSASSAANPYVNQFISRVSTGRPGGEQAAGFDGERGESMAAGDVARRGLPPDGAVLEGSDNGNLRMPAHGSGQFRASVSSGDTTGESDGTPSQDQGPLGLNRVLTELGSRLSLGLGGVPNTGDASGEPHVSSASLPAEVARAYQSEDGVKALDEGSGTRKEHFGDPTRAAEKQLGGPSESDQKRPPKFLSVPPLSGTADFPESLQSSSDGSLVGGNSTRSLPAASSRLVSSASAARSQGSLWSLESPMPGVQYGSEAHRAPPSSVSHATETPRWGKSSGRSASLFGQTRSPWGKEASPGWLSDESLNLPLSEMPKGFTVNVMDEGVMAGLRLFPCRARADRSNAVKGTKLGEFKRRYVGVCSNYFMLLSPHPSRSHLLEVKLIRFLQDIVRITFKRSRPELVTFEVLGPMEPDAPNEHIVCIMPEGLKQCVYLIKEYLGQEEEAASNTEQAQDRAQGRELAGGQTGDAEQQSGTSSDAFPASRGHHELDGDRKQTSEPNQPSVATEDESHSTTPPDHGKQDNVEWGSFQMSIALPPDLSRGSENSKASSSTRSPPPFPSMSPLPFASSPPSASIADHASARGVVSGAADRAESVTEDAKRIGSSPPKGRVLQDAPVFPTLGSADVASGRGSKSADLVSEKSTLTRERLSRGRNSSLRKAGSAQETGSSPIERRSPGKGSKGGTNVAAPVPRRAGPLVADVSKVIPQ